MNKSIIYFSILFILACGNFMPSFGFDQPTNKTCRQHPRLSGQCFDLRGRLSFYNGTPSLRIWPVESHRLLGISEGRFALPGFSNIPPGLVDKLAGFDNDLFADFRLCPFTDDQPGVMRFVCVEAANNSVVRRRSGQEQRSQ
jgi:hypothetical protein